MKTDNEVNLSNYSSKEYNPGANIAVRIVWYIINIIVFKSYFFPFNSFKAIILKLFGSKIGKNITIKPNINIKYPWFLEVGNSVWLGEGVWIDNLDKVTIGSNVCISQNAYLLTGSHNYNDPKFKLITKQIIIKDGCWVCAGAIICPGVEMKKNSIALTGAVIFKSTDENCIYQGNPAELVRSRSILASSEK